MNELEINYNLESPQEKNSSILISVNNMLKEKLTFKYMVGHNGVWNTLSDFTEATSVKWVPNEEGKYIIIVEARKKDGIKSFDYVSKGHYLIGDTEEKLIENISLDKHLFSLGEKINLFVNTNRIPLMFRYWIKTEDKWKIIKDYSADNTFSWVAKFQGKGEILVECKNIDSKKRYDDSQKVDFEVKDVKKVEIQDFKAINKDLLQDSELVFKVEAFYEEERNILYKFIKINEKGEMKCVQDFSTKSVVNYIENEIGDYKLLCLAKDMYSNNEFDDRAIINFTVKRYKDICIKNFTTDLNSPQLCGTVINLNADVIGGREIQYRYKIDGDYKEDSGYIRDSNYQWETRMPGKYEITLFVKDKSFEGKYEDFQTIDFVIDEKSKEPVKINEIFMENKQRLLINETINAEVKASGGTELKYSFIIRKDNRELENICWNKKSHISFLLKEQGNYELEVRVKDKYSDREFDCHEMLNLEVLSCIPAEIDYILFPYKEYYMVGDKVELNIITQNTANTVVKYVLKISNHEVEQTDYTENKVYSFMPRCSGIYSIEVFAKNKDSDKVFDSKKSIVIKIHEALPVNNTKISCDKTEFLCNESITFTAKSQGGKDIIYEFYIMENEEWILVQNYSKKDYYVYIPFIKGTYKVLVLAKSQYYRGAYEDYDIITFSV